MAYQPTKKKKKTKAKPKKKGTLGKIATYAKENKLEAAALAAMAVPVVGWGAAGVLRGAAGAAKLYKKRKLIKGAAKKVYAKITGSKTLKSAGRKVKEAVGPKHKQYKKKYTARGHAEKARTMGKRSWRYETVRLKDKKEIIGGPTKKFPKRKTKTKTVKQYGIRPSAAGAATSKKAIFGYGAGGYYVSQPSKSSASAPKKTPPKSTPKPTPKRKVSNKSVTSAQGKRHTPGSIRGSRLGSGHSRPSKSLRGVTSRFQKIVAANRKKLGNY